MLAFVVLSSSDGTPIDPTIAERLARVDLPELPFVPDQHFTWTNASKTTCFFGWQAFPEIGDMDDHWFVRNGNLTTFSGLPAWLGGSWPAGQSWAESLSDRLDAQPFPDLQESLLGMYTITRLSKHEGGFVASDQMSGGQLYHATLPGVNIVANRASLVARAITPARKRLEKDWRGPGWLLFWKQGLGLETGYSGVELLPQSGYLNIDNRGRSQFAIADQMPWTYPDPSQTPKSFEECLDQADAYFRSAIRSLAALPFPRKELRFSGGKDSRLLVAFAIAEGVIDQFNVLTYGHRDSADVELARKLGNKYGFKVEFDDRTMLGEFEGADQIRIHTAQVDGSKSAWDICADTLAINQARISGALSTSIRPIALGRKLLEADQNYLNVLLTARANDRDLLLQEHVRDYYRHSLRQFYHHYVDLLGDPAEFAVTFLSPLGGRRWVGVDSEVSASPWAFPYHETPPWRIFAALDRDDRLTERLPFELMSRTVPEFVSEPLVGSVWPEGAWRDHASANPVPTSPYQKAGGSPTHWRVTGFPDLLPWFREVLLDRSNPLYEIADYTRIEELLERDSFSYGAITTLYSVMTAALWLGDHEELERIRRVADVGKSRRQEINTGLLINSGRLPVELSALDIETESVSVESEKDQPTSPLTADSSICALIPHSGGERYLADAIDSLMRQTRALQAIIVIDDNSPEPPRDIVSEFPEVTLIRSTESSGPYRLIQTVIDQTDFDGYLFQDADDWSAPERLELLLDESIRTGAELVGCQGFRVIEDEHEVLTYHHPVLASEVLQDHPAGTPVHHPATLASRNLIQRIGGFGTGFRFSGDTEFARRASYETRIVNVPNHLYYYRTRSDSLTGSEQTGNHTPVRRDLWKSQHQVAHENAQRVEAGIPPNLSPMSMSDPADLQHVCGPQIAGMTSESGANLVDLKLDSSQHATTGIAGSRDASVPRPIFIIGSMRSGGSLLASSLEQHPDVTRVLEISWLAELSSRLHQIYAEAVNPPETADLIIDGIDTELFVGHVGAAIDSLLLQGSSTALLDPVDSFDLGEPERKAFSSILEPTRWIAEGPDLIDHAFAMHRLFPHAHFIHVIRNPDDVVRSLTDESGRRLFRSRFTEMSEEEALSHWSNRTDHCIQLEQALGSRKVTRIDRDDLIEDPEGILTQVLKQISLTWEPAMLRPFR